MDTRALKVEADRGRKDESDAQRNYSIHALHQHKPLYRRHTYLSKAEMMSIPTRSAWMRGGYQLRGCPHGKFRPEGLDRRRHVESRMLHPRLPDWDRAALWPLRGLMSLLMYVVLLHRWTARGMLWDVEHLILEGR